MYYDKFLHFLLSIWAKNAFLAKNREMITLNKYSHANVRIEKNIYTKAKYLSHSTIPPQFWPFMTVT